MRVAEYDRYGGPDVISVRERPVPDPRRGEVLIRVEAAALNPKDVLTRAGKYWFAAGARFPKRMGYDWAGEAVKLGPGVASVQPGQALFGMIQAWSAGSCAEYLVAKLGELAAKPAALSWEEAAALPLTGLTALQALRAEARLQVGQRLLINGASGGVGVCAVQIAKAMGAHVTTLTSAVNQELVRSLGADETLDYATCDLTQLEQRYDVFFDVFGNRSLSRVRHLLTPRGTYVTTVPKPEAVVRHAVSGFTQPRGRLVVVRSCARDLQLISGFVAEGRLRPVIAQTYTLDTLGDAHHALASKHTRGKLVVQLGERAAINQLPDPPGQVAPQVEAERGRIV